MFFYVCISTLKLQDEDVQNNKLSKRLFVTSTFGIKTFSITNFFRSDLDGSQSVSNMMGRVDVFIISISNPLSIIVIYLQCKTRMTLYSTSSWFRRPPWMGDNQTEWWWIISHSVSLTSSLREVQVVFSTKETEGWQYNENYFELQCHSLFVPLIVEEK